MIDFCESYSFFGFPVVTDIDSKGKGLLMGYANRTEMLDDLQEALAMEKVKRTTHCAFFEDENYTPIMYSLRRYVDRTVARMSTG